MYYLIQIRVKYILTYCGGPVKLFYHTHGSGRTDFRGNCGIVPLENNKGLVSKHLRANPFLCLLPVPDDCRRAVQTGAVVPIFTILLSGCRGSFLKRIHQLQFKRSFNHKFFIGKREFLHPDIVNPGGRYRVVAAGDIYHHGQRIGSIVHVLIFHGVARCYVSGRKIKVQYI